MSNLKPEIFLEAAKTLGQGSKLCKFSPFCCDRINDLNDWENKNPQLKLFKTLFEPISHFGIWWANPHETDEDQEARRLALLFAYEIAKEKQNG